MNKHDHVTGRPRDYISKKWFHRGRHREGQSVEQLIDHLNREILEANPQGRWQLSADGKHYLFSGIVAFPTVSDWNDESNNAVIMIESPGSVTNFPPLVCPHENREVNVETEDYYSNGMFGVPASNIPLMTDIVDETVHCTDCGQQLVPTPMLYDRKLGWHNDDE